MGKMKDSPDFNFRQVTASERKESSGGKNKSAADKIYIVRAPRQTELAVARKMLDKHPTSTPMLFTGH